MLGLEYFEPTPGRMYAFEFIRDKLSPKAQAKVLREIDLIRSTGLQKAMERKRVGWVNHSIPKVFDVKLESDQSFLRLPFLIDGGTMSCWMASKNRLTSLRKMISIEQSIGQKHFI